MKTPNANPTSEREALTTLGISLRILEQVLREALPEELYWSVRNTVNARIHEELER
jgi:hypothetical protein